MMAQETSAELSLKGAMRDARVDEMTRQDAILSMREAEYARLGLLADYLRPVFADIPPHIDLFDVGLVAGDRPRYFIDMVAFVEMDEGKHTYCFYQDTRAGRMLLGRATKREEAAKLVLDYVARRLVAREQLLAMPLTQDMPQTHALPNIQVSQKKPTLIPEKISLKERFLPKLSMKAEALKTEAVKAAAQKTPLTETKLVPEVFAQAPVKGGLRAEAGLTHVQTSSAPSNIVKTVEKFKRELNLHSSALSTLLYVGVGLLLAASAYVLLARLLDMALQQ